MDSHERDKLISKVLHDFETVLNCSAEAARTVLSTAEGFKFNGTSKEDARSYLTQLLWKLQLTPTAEAIAHIDDYLNVHSIIVDVNPEDNKVLFNPHFPFLAGLTYQTDPNQTTSSMEEDFTKSRMHDRMKSIPRKLPNFFYVEQHMPQEFYSMCNNPTVESVLSKGFIVDPHKPLHLWLTPAEARHAFTTGLDVGATRIATKDLNSGTLVSINSDFLYRRPEVFTPLHRHSRIICMQYKTSIERRAIEVYHQHKPLKHSFHREIA